ncbi:hypothetical protein D3C71_1721990 [compost metagenome]
MHGDVGQSAEQGQLVGGNLLVSIEHALYLVDSAQGAVGAQFQQQRVPARPSPGQGIVGIPAAYALKPQSREQQLNLVSGVSLEQPTTGIALVHQVVAPG